MLTPMNTMVTVLITIIEEEDSVRINFKGEGKGNTDLEADIADTFRLVLKETRNQLYKQLNAEIIEKPPETYIRSFDSPEERDKRL